MESTNEVLVKNELRIEKHSDRICVLTINKPERKNAISPEMMDFLADTLLQLDRDDEVNVIVLKGQGENFSAGGDLKAARAPGVENSRNVLRKYGRAVQTIIQIEKPVIALVDGYAIGGGMSLALACDVVLASERAKFSSNFLQVGLIPEMGALLLLPMTAGLNKAKELWFSARMIAASEAKELGIVNQIVEADRLEAEGLAFARQVAQMPATAVRITKRLSNSIACSLLNATLETEAQASPFCIETADHQAYVQSFLNRK